MFILENLFERELPEVQMPVSFRARSQPISMESNGLIEYTRQVRPCVLGLFRPKGVLSRQPQQPLYGNHRSMKPEVLLQYHKKDNHHDWNPPMMMTMMDDSPICSFSNGSHIGYTPFQVQCDLGGHPLSSQSRVEKSVDGGKTESVFLEDPRLTAYFVTNGVFRRTLRTFGFEWSDMPKNAENKRCHPRFICTFLEMISEYPITTNVEIKNSMENFKLDRIHKFDQSKTPAENRNDLCHVISAVQQLRLSVYDGQHRDAAIQFGSIGYWTPSKRVILDPVVWQRSFLDTKEAGLFPFEAPGVPEDQFQCFSTIPF